MPNTFRQFMYKSSAKYRSEYGWYKRPTFEVGQKYTLDQVMPEEEELFWAWTERGQIAIGQRSGYFLSVNNQRENLYNNRIVRWMPVSKEEQECLKEVVRLITPRTVVIKQTDMRNDIV
jgi:hypothetical protein